VFPSADSATLKPNAAEIRCVAFSPDGSLLAAGTRYGLVKVWDTVGRQELQTLRGHAGDVWAIAFSGDGKLFATTDGDWNKPSHVRLYETQKWKEQASLAHTGEVLSLSFAPKNLNLAAGSWDKSVKVWDLTGTTPALPSPKPAK